MNVAGAVKAAYDCYHVEPTLVGTGENRNIQVVRYETDPIIIAFPGSIELRDWVLDFLAFPHDVKDHPELGQVHSGFLEAAQSVSTQIDQLLEGKDYITVGHSLGGALAILVPCLLKKRPLAIYAFAPPRVFVDQVPDWIVEITHAFRFGNDPVPDVPSWFPHVPVLPVGKAKSIENARECHHIENYVSALS